MADGICENSLVIVHCGNPREKMWGVVVRLDAVEDWIRQERAGSDKLIGPTTFFVPMHRVLRIDLDDDTPVVESYHNRFATASGRDALEALLETSGRDA